MLCQSECMSTSNSKQKYGSFLFKNNENTYPKGRALVQMYRIVPQTKRGKFKDTLWYYVWLWYICTVLHCRIYEAVHERQKKNPKELTVEKGDIVQVSNSAQQHCFIMISNLFPKKGPQLIHIYHPIGSASVLYYETFAHFFPQNMFYRTIKNK